jgi:hypothetical protein
LSPAAARCAAMPIPARFITPQIFKVGGNFEQSAGGAGG